jgi:Ankyrin repeat
LLLGLQDGWTPLHFAAWGGHDAVIEALYGAGAEVDSRDKVQISVCLGRWAPDPFSRLCVLLFIVGAFFSLEWLRVSWIWTPLHCRHFLKVLLSGLS